MAGAARVPIAWNTCLQLGFVNWVLALPLLVLHFTALVRWYRAPGRLALAGLVLLPVALFVAHAQALLFAYGAVGLLGVVERSPRRGWPTLAALAPSIALFSWWYATHFGGAGAGFTRFEGVGAGFGASFLPLGTRLNQTAGFLVGIYTGYQDEALMWAWLALLVGWAAATRRATWSRERAFVALLSAAAALGYLFLPDRIAQQWFISQRMLPLAAGLAIAALPTGLPGAVGEWLAGAAWVVSLGLVAVLAREYRAFSPSMEAAVHLLDRVPPDQEVLELPFDDWSPHAEHRVFQHASAYYLVRSPGVLSHSFFTLPSYPVRQLDPGPMPLEGHAAELDAWCGLLRGESAGAGWILVRGSDRGLMAGLAPTVRLEASEAEWRLYRSSGPIAASVAARWSKRLECPE